MNNIFKKKTWLYNMPVYECFLCNFTTELKANFNQHLSTKKHKNNSLNHTNLDVKKYTKTIKKIRHNGSKKSLLNPKMDSNPNESYLNPNESLLNHSESLLNPNESLMNPNESFEKKIKKYYCKYCSKEYSTSSNMHRHLKKCQAIKNTCLLEELSNMKKNHNEELQKQKDKIKTMEKEKDDMKKQIEILLNKVGDTNITNNTIVLNCYGSENLKHITDSFKTDLLKIPYAMIPKLIEAVHFNKDVPENKNILLPNKNAPYVKVYENTGWTYKDKKETIKELVDKNYNILDSHYERNSKSLEGVHKERYDEFTDKLKNSDTGKKVITDVGLIFINNNN